MRKSDDVSAQLPKLVHDLGNALETILQACYLVQQTELSSDNKKWIAMIETAATDAARINRSMREILGSGSAQPPARRRA